MTNAIMPLATKVKMASPIKVAEAMATLLTRVVKQEDEKFAALSFILMQFIQEVGVNDFKDLPNRKQGKLSDDAYVLLYDAYSKCINPN